MINRKSIFAVIIFLFTVGLHLLVAEIPPVYDPAKKGATPIRNYRLKNLYTIDDIQLALKNSGKDYLLFDITHVKILLDGKTINPENIYGEIYFGPYPFEAKEVEYSYKRFRRRARILQGNAKVRLGSMFSGYVNSEDWTDTGKFVLRVVLRLENLGSDRRLGMYDIFAWIKKTGDRIELLPTLTEGPLICKSTSDSPGSLVIAYRTSVPVDSKVIIEGVREFAPDEKTNRAEIKITELKPDTEYKYYLLIGDIRSKVYSFRTPPPVGKGSVKFVYLGDSREGVGADEETLMGVNAKILERELSMAYRMGARFMIQGGDLINGYTTNKKDFITQMRAYKQIVSGFWHLRPIFPGIGNHESLLNYYHDPQRKNVFIDKQPYKTDSAEAVFADELVNPVSGLQPHDPRLPTYDETVFSFKYGPVKIISFNNNYWRSTHPQEYGGCPQGYIFENQVEWIRKEVKEGENDPGIKHIILFAQEPVFPNGGHVGDTMWWNGNNNVRAYIRDAATGELKPERKGIIEIRDSLLDIFHSSGKVAAVLGCDEHAYHKMLVSNKVPIGNLSSDDLDGNGIICEKGEPCSPRKSLKYPVWYIISGGAGAPYYAEEPTPWNKYWKQQPETDRYYYYSSQWNFFLFEADTDNISVTIYNPFGEVIDRIADLQSVKKISCNQI